MQIKHKKVLTIVRNSIVHQEKSPSMRQIAEEMGYKSPRSAFLLVKDLINQGYLRRKENGDLQIVKQEDDLNEAAQTINVPLVGNVACGSPILAKENIEANIPVSVRIAREPHKYFFLRAKGDSMDKDGINNGDLVLIRQQDTANKGENVVALINDEATIKKFWPQNNETIILKPHSTNSQHKPIILHEDFRIQGVVVKGFKGLI